MGLQYLLRISKTTWAFPPPYLRSWPSKVYLASLQPSFEPRKITDHLQNCQRTPSSGLVWKGRLVESLHHLWPFRLRLLTRMLASPWTWLLTHIPQSARWDGWSTKILLGTKRKLKIWVYQSKSCCLGGSGILHNLKLCLVLYPAMLTGARFCKKQDLSQDLWRTGGNRNFHGIGIVQPGSFQMKGRKPLFDQKRSCQRILKHLLKRKIFAKLSNLQLFWYCFPHHMRSMHRQRWSFRCQALHSIRGSHRNHQCMYHHLNRRRCHHFRRCQQYRLLLDLRSLWSLRHR